MYRRLLRPLKRSVLRLDLPPLRTLFVEFDTNVAAASLVAVVFCSSSLLLPWLRSFGCCRFSRFLSPMSVTELVTSLSKRSVAAPMFSVSEWHLFRPLSQQPFGFLIPSMFEESLDRLPSSSSVCLHCAEFGQPPHFSSSWKWRECKWGSDFSDDISMTGCAVLVCCPRSKHKNKCFLKQMAKTRVKWLACNT